MIFDNPHVSIDVVKEGEISLLVPKDRKDYNEGDRKKVEKNYKAKKILLCGIGPDKYNRISTCEFAKEIWDSLTKEI